MVYQLTYSDVQRLAELMVLVSFMCGGVGFLVTRFLCGFIAMIGNAVNRRHRIQQARARAALKYADGVSRAGLPSPGTAPVQPISGSA